MDQFTPMVQASINSSFHSSINDTPFHVFTGRDFILPIHNVFKGLDSNFDNHRDADYVPNLLYALNKSYEVVKKTSKKARAKRADRFKNDRKIRLSDAKQGDLILVNNESQSGAETRAFSNRYTGPYRVLQKYNNKNLLIQDLSNLHNKKIIHVDRSRLLHTLPNYDYLTNPQFSIENSRQSSNDTNNTANSDQNLQPILKKADKQNLIKKPVKKVRFAENNRVATTSVINNSSRTCENSETIAKENYVATNKNVNKVERAKPDFSKVISFLKQRLLSKHAVQIHNANE